MADVSWISSVRTAGTLTIDTGGVHGPAWSTAVAAAIRELNTLFTSNGINVTLTTGESALVKIALSSGTYQFPVDGKNVPGTMRTDVLHGVTRGIDRDTGRSINREQAFIFLPLNPRVDPAAAKSREVGEPVRRVMAAHELVHALGIDKHDPGFQGLMAGTWTLNEASKPPGDTVTPFGGSTKLPPLTLSKDTVTRLKALWP